MVLLFLQHSLPVGYVPLCLRCGNPVLFHMTGSWRRAAISALQRTVTCFKLLRKFRQQASNKRTTLSVFILKKYYFYKWIPQESCVRSQSCEWLIYDRAGLEINASIHCVIFNTFATVKYKQTIVNFFHVNSMHIALQNAASNAKMSHPHCFIRCNSPYKLSMDQ
jgi:hypothetical protein